MRRIWNADRRNAKVVRCQHIHGGGIVKAIKVIGYLFGVLLLGGAVLQAFALEGTANEIGAVLTVAAAFFAAKSAA